MKYINFSIDWVKKLIECIWNTLAIKTNQSRILIKIYNFYVKVKNINKIFPPMVWDIGGPEIFIKTGNQFLDFIINKECLRPDENILEIGCGMGRIAFALTKYLTIGKYEGFDIRVRDIEWLQKNITSKFSNFHFQVADVYNKFYNPNGKIFPSNYKFQYPNNSFDFVILISVFPQMLPKDMDHYFFEIFRVLKEGGKCLISFFLLNKTSMEFLNKKLSTFDFKYEFEGYRTINKEIHEVSVAYDENHIRNLFQKNGLKILEPIYYGDWYNKDKTEHAYHVSEINFQDIIIAKKINLKTNYI